jgi:hypothetical protein
MGVSGNPSPKGTTMRRRIVALAAAIGLALGLGSAGLYLGGWAVVSRPLSPNGTHIVAGDGVRDQVTTGAP